MGLVTKTGQGTGQYQNQKPLQVESQGLHLPGEPQLAAWQTGYLSGKPPCGTTEIYHIRDP